MCKDASLHDLVEQHRLREREREWGREDVRKWGREGGCDGVGEGGTLETDVEHT